MQYYKHMSNMRHDKRIKKLIIKYGVEGYGWYNLVLESITENLTTQKPMPDLEENCEELALLYKGDTARINEMICWMINEGLLELNEITNCVACNKLYRYLESAQTRSKELREMIKKYKESYKQLQIDASQMSVTVSDKTEEKNKREENIKEEKKKYKNNVFLTKNEHNNLITDYGLDLTEKFITRLSHYKKAHGKSYESDYDAILSWVVKAEEKDNNPFNKPQKDEVFYPDAMEYLEQNNLLSDQEEEPLF